MTERKRRGITEPTTDAANSVAEPPDKYTVGMALRKTPDRWMVRVKKVVFEGFITLDQEAALLLQDELWSSKAEDEETIVFLRRGSPPSANDYKSVEELKEAIKNG